MFSDLPMDIACPDSIKGETIILLKDKGLPQTVDEMYKTLYGYEIYNPFKWSEGDLKEEARKK